ncbi:MAG: NAD(P)/FAD-dependent oxidoreductase [candidate division NC10 bacterium]|nr:NAD(P)/FAD-dependent oxidoreductase [candidate division NC10 bacterium]
MNKQFDLIVIGTGAAGATAAYKCRSAGWEVAIADARPFGGTCALRGCDPKKVLVGAAELVDWQHRMARRAVVTNGLKIDWPALMRFKRTFTEPVPKNREEGYAKAGIATLHDRARFIGPTTLEVGDQVLTGRHVLIANGARPATLAIRGEEHLTTSDQFLELDRLPPRILFVGGGYISFEFAHIAAQAGAQARVLHRGSRPLAGFDSDLVDQLVRATREIGVDVRLNTTVEGIERGRGQLIVHALAEGVRQTFEAEMVVHGAGRVPEIDDLGLEAAGVRWGQKGVVVNEYLQSVSNPAVYAAGDSAASGGLPLTPVASLEGHVVASNLLEGNHRTPDYTGVPTVVFTVPSLASIGLQEETARQRGLKFRAKHGDTGEWYSSRRVGVRHSGFKVLIEEGTERILGAHLLGPHAEEVINLFALAIRAGLRAADLKTMPWAYPTSSSDVSYMV